MSRVGAVVRALASHQCVPGSIPGPGVICGLSLLLVLYSAPRGFSPGTPVFPSHQKPTLLNSIWKQWMKSHLVEMPLQIPIIIIIIIIIITLYYQQKTYNECICFEEYTTCLNLMDKYFPTLQLHSLNKDISGYKVA